MLICCNVLLIILEPYPAHTAVEMIRYWISECPWVKILHKTYVTSTKLYVLPHGLLPQLFNSINIFVAVLDFICCSNNIEGRVGIKMEAVKVIHFHS